MATGATSAAEILLVSLPSLVPVAILTGHSDWVFASEFVRHDVLISGSRDSTVKVWSFSDEQFTTDDFESGLPLAQHPSRLSPVITRKEHEAKVRALQCHQQVNSFCTLGSEGCVKIWDSANLDVLTTVALEDANDLACMTLQENHDLIAVGSQHWVTLIDRRSAIIINQIRSVDQGCGVRSLNFLGPNIMSVGGGMGRLSFYDLCAERYINVGKVEESVYLPLGEGWLDKGAMYQTHFHNTEVPNAVYTHSYDPTFTRLFVGGGPLLAGLKGAYAAFW